MLGLMAKGSIANSIMGIFDSFIFAITELLGTILVISIIVAMSKVLLRTGINEVMISPVTNLIKTPTLAYWITGILMMTISWFFWPSPAVALLGAVLLPVAVRAGLPAMGVAMAMNLFGHGIALSGDFVIQGAPKLTAAAAGIPVSDVVAASVPLVFIMGIITTSTAFFLLKRDLKKGELFTGEPLDDSALNSQSANLIDLKSTLSMRQKTALAIAVPILYLADVMTMFRGNDCISNRRISVWF
ncbi:MAG: C4-dicarboxylate transporter [Anaerospora sp.]|nr:C4-dicarboxylate transporter [Anaerospora sp.]